MLEYKTQDQKANEINAYCEERNHIENKCDGCPIEKPCSRCYGHFRGEEYFMECFEAYEILKAGKPTLDEVTVPEVTHDAVNHPKHYCREGAMECIDEMVLIFGKEAVKHFCICNAWKYRARAMNKNGEEDLKKSDWYIKKFKELNDACI